MIIYVDFDNTLCITEGVDYANSKPIKERINVINELYKKHEIVIYTARGSLSKINYEELTLGQLNKWGVSFHKLDIGNKPVFDLLIDDRALSDKHFFDDINNINL
jgi:CMP-N,N'-diacetyllegionaminic acid synthase